MSGRRGSEATVPRWTRSQRRRLSLPVHAVLVRQYHLEIGIDCRGGPRPQRTPHLFEGLSSGQSRYVV